MKKRTFAATMALILSMAPWMNARAQEQASPSTAVPAIPEDQRPTDAQLNRLFEAMRVNQQMAAARQAMPQLMKQQFDQQVREMEKDHPEMASMTDQQRQAVSKIMQKYMSQAMTLYTPEEAMADMRTIYQKHLSQADVEAATAFYSSPPGQHILDMVPAIMQEFIPSMMTKMMTKMRPLIVEMSKEIAAVMKPSGANQQ
jgi:uncharacterized protein